MSNSKNQEYIPVSTKNFVEYFEKYPPEGKELRMLLLNYYSPNHTITASTLAAAMGWKNFNSANLRYGEFSGKTAKAMKSNLPIDNLQVSFFVDFNKPDQDESHWQWILRLELVQAIHQLGLDTEIAKNKAESDLRTAEIMLM